MTKGKIIPIIIILILIVSVVGIFFLIGSIGLFSLIEDHMAYVDDFESGIDFTKWDYSVNYFGECGGRTGLVENNDITEWDLLGVKDGKLFTTGKVSSNLYCPIQKYRTTISSKRVFTTEDIKIKVNSVWNDNSRNENGGCMGSPYPTIQFGDSIIQLPYTNKVYSERCSRSGEISRMEIEGILEIKRYDDLDTSKYVILWQGEEIDTGSNSGPVKLSFYDNVQIDWVKFEPYYSCNINYENEVVVRDMFLGDSTIDINSLAYVPTKFCPQDLGVLIYSDEGFTDEKGTITQSLAEGKLLTIPDEQYWQIDYVTDYVEEMEERCGIGEAYSTENNRCIQVVQQLIPDDTLLFCKVDSDCLIPKNCEDATVKCVNSQCDYSSAQCTPTQIINYLEVIKTVEIDSTDILVISEGSNEVFISGEAVVLGEEFTNDKPFVLIDKCYVDWNNYINEEGCYQSFVRWGEYDFFVIDGKSEKLNDYITVDYSFSGKGAFRGCKDEDKPEEKCYDYTFIRDTDWLNNYKITFNDLIKIKDVDNPEKVLLNSDASVSVVIQNNIGTIPSGGYNIQVSKGLRDIYHETTENDMIFVPGENHYIIKIPTDELGVYTVSLTPYVDLTDDKRYFNERVSFGYYVTDNPDEIIVQLDTNDGFWSRLWRWFLNLFSK